MAITKKVLKALVPVLSCLRVKEAISKTNDSVYVGKLKFVGGVVVIREKDNYDIKINGIHRNFIILDLDDTAIPSASYVKSRWLKSMLILRVGSDGIKVICVAKKDGAFDELGATFFASLLA